MKIKYSTIVTSRGKYSMKRTKRLAVNLQIYRW